MKVALLIDTWFPLIGGGQINALEISKRIASEKIEINIITRDNGIDNIYNTKYLKVIKIGHRSDPNNTISKILFIFKAFIYVYKSDYDLVHAHAFLPGITARLLMVFKGLPAIFTVHGTSIITNLNSYFSRRIEKFILTEVLYSAQITVSRDFLKIKNINKKIHYIPNGVNILEYDKVSAKKAVRPTLIFVGRLHPQKNLSLLIDAIELVLPEIKNISLLIIGRGVEEEKLKQKVKEAGLSKNIIFLGEERGIKLIKRYKTSWLFVLPSIYEGLPLTLLEAWASKIPVLVTKSGDNSFIVKEGENGYLINKSNNVQEISSSIIKALKNKKLGKLGEEGYKLTKTNYSWKKSAILTKNLYEKTV